ncbi:MAG: VWA domain-containing protein [Rhodospirillaceae bacterium]|nr:VWA domain-containing protein [Rhodospirillaceae bacterium]
MTGIDAIRSQTSARPIRSACIGLALSLSCGLATPAGAQQTEAPVASPPAQPASPATDQQPAEVIRGLEDGQIGDFPLLQRAPQTNGEASELIELIENIIRQNQIRQYLWDQQLTEWEATFAETGSAEEVAAEIAELDARIAAAALRTAYEQQESRLADAMTEQLALVVADPQPTATPTPTPAPAPETAQPPIVVAGPREPVGDRVPLRQEEIPELFRRVLTLPGAVLHDAPGGRESDGAPLPTFTVRYVYSDTGDWVEVGPDPYGGVSGWLPRGDVEDWRNMLVMQFMPPGGRTRVLFFNQLQDLVRQVRAHYGTTPGVLRDLEEIELGILTDELAARYAAIEPRTSVEFEANPYLLPILDWQFETFTVTGEETTLVQVAGLNSQESAIPEDDERAIRLVDDTGVGNISDDLGEFGIGVVFVVDTTTSMTPYVLMVRETIISLYQSLGRSGLMDQAAFGLIGFRDDVSLDPRIGYVTRIYQDLRIGDRPERLLINLENVSTSPVSTSGWNEDVFAGLVSAIEDLNWEPFDLRLIVVISDAGPRPFGDPRSLYPLIGPASIVEMAQRNDIVIVPIHLLTPEGARFNNHDYARAQYIQISDTGILSLHKYVGLSTDTLGGFRLQLAGFTDNFERAVQDMALGIRQQPSPSLLCDNRQLPPALFPELACAEADQPVQPGTNVPPPTAQLGEIFTNELFRAQLQFLGAEGDVAGPRFRRAWSADKDLANPSVDSMEVRVFLTRNQLNELALRLEDILAIWRRADQSPQDVFRTLQELAASTANYGEVVQTQASDVARPIGELLPAYLRALPYRSRILQLTEQDWINQSETGRASLIAELERKLETYRRINADTDHWEELGADDPGLQVYPLPLRELP